MLIHNRLLVANLITAASAQPICIRGPQEVVMHVIRELQVIDVREIRLILALLRLAELPLPAEILDLVFAVEFRVVVLAGTPPALPQRQVAWVYRDAVVLGLAALASLKAFPTQLPLSA